MAKKIYQNYDFAGNQIVGLRAENLGSYPAAGSAGRLVFNTSTSAIALDTGASFLPILTAVTWSDVTGKPTTFTPSAHVHTIANVTSLQTSLDAKAALASPAFSGTPTAPTQIVSDDSTKIATTGFVKDVVASFGAGDMTKAVYDTTDNGKVDLAEVAEAAPWSGITGKPATFTPSAHNHPQSDITGLVAALAGKSATGHTHTASQVTDFSAEVDNRIVAYFDTEAASDNDLDTLRELIDTIKDNRSDLLAQIQRYDQSFGNGAATSIAITHNLASLDVSVEVYEIATGETVGVGVTRTSSNVVTIEAIPAPASNALRVVIKR